MRARGRGEKRLGTPAVRQAPEGSEVDVGQALHAALDPGDELSERRPAVDEGLLGAARPTGATVLAAARDRVVVTRVELELALVLRRDVRPTEGDAPGLVEHLEGRR